MFRTYRSLSILTFVALAAVWAGSGGNSAERAPAPGTERQSDRPVGASADRPPVPGAEFHQKLREIAAAYTTWSRVDNESHWAPTLCGPPLAACEDLSVKFSKSKDGDTHGQKLYSLFVSEKKAYRTGDQQPVGQVVVKQSWTPEEVRADDPRLSRQIPRPKDAVDVTRTATKDGKLYLAAKQADLFIMFKTDPKTPNTDEGWVYGTVTPDGKTVTSAGRVESCMACHKDAKADRLFGIKSKSE
jgi:hypothetical protein